MIITSNGRVIFWESRIRQDKALDSRAYFKLSYSTHIASIHDLRQMRISYEHKKQGFYWFCPRYEAAVQLSFYSFNHKDSSRSKFLRTFPVKSYLQALKSFISGKVKTGPRDQEDALVVGISTDVRDKQNTPYAYENSEQALDEMIIMCENMMKHFGSIRDSFLKSNAYVPMNRSNIHQVRVDDENFKSATRKYCCRYLSLFIVSHTFECRAI